VSLPSHPSSSIVHVPAPQEPHLRDAQGDGAQASDTAKILAALTAGHPQIDHIDVVIANAGTTGSRQSILETSAENLLECLQVNALAPLKLLQTTWPLLKRAKTPKFVFIGSVAGSVAGVDETGGWSNAAYGVSKVAGNYLVRKAGKELEGQLAVCVIHPGWVQSETGNERAVKQGLEKAPVALNDSAQGILEEITHMIPGKDAGFRTFDHGNISW
jgi:norsolorinic acid ketoreductase